MTSMEPLSLGVSRFPPTTGDLLVASPLLRDPNFAHTVVLLIEVNADGAVGLVLNRPTETPVTDVLDGIDPVAPPVLFEGGPVGTDSAITISEQSGSVRVVDVEEVDVLPTRLRVFAGYSGWSPGQLEAEILEGSWYVVPGRAADAFHESPQSLWQQVLRRETGMLPWLSTMPMDPELN